MKIAHYLIQTSTFICITLCMNTALFLCGEERTTQEHKSLRIISTTKAGDVPYGVYAVNGYAYITNNNELLIFNVSNPEKITTIPRTQAAWNIHVHEDYLFLGRHQNGVDIFSIADIKMPRLIGHFNDDDGGEALSVWGDDDYLYVADNFGVEVLDIHEPSHPRQIEELGGLGCTHDIFVEGRLLFIASVKKDLIILEFASK